MKKKVAIYWARRDLRLTDNPALRAAVEYAKKEAIPFLPIYILEDYMVTGDATYQFGLPSRYFLAKALSLFSKKFPHFVVFQGKAARTIISLADEIDITLFVNEDVYKDFYTQLKRIRTGGIEVKLFSDALTISKDTRTGTGNIYSVFTPFKNAVWSDFCSKKVLPKVSMEEVTFFSGSFGALQKKKIEHTEHAIRKTFAQTRTFLAGGVQYDIDTLLQHKNTYDNWYADEEGAVKQFDIFLKHTISEYKNKRDFLDLEATSHMSLGLAWGLVSARMLRKKIEHHFDSNVSKDSFGARMAGPVQYISELIWREFYTYLFYHYPELMNQEFQQKFRGAITWVDEKTAHERFKKWIQGQTGYPIVDAAMMELAATGYMHNRARMIVASVLTKNLGVDWRWGQEYFRAMLIDLYEASNNGGWQWAASVGADPKPIRIFNPYLQASNYDKNNLYQKKYLSEEYLAMPPDVVVDHKLARAAALARYGLQ